MVGTKRSTLEERSKAIDRIVAEVDPIMVAGATAAGVAGACGMKGPLTMILAAMQGNNTNVTIPEFFFEVGTLGVVPTIIGNLLTGKSLTGDGGTQQATENQMKNVGYAMSNVCEFMIVYAFATNPGTPEAMAKMVDSLGGDLKILGTLIKK